MGKPLDSEPNSAGKKRDEEEESGANEPGSRSSESKDDSEAREVRAISEVDLPRSQIQKDGERPGKRRKTDTGEPGEPHASSPEEDEPPAKSSSPAPRARSPTPPVALPAFPRPRKPEAPSKSVLALQGLDKALIEAEVVDPATTVPLDTGAKGAQDERTGLSGRIRSRLKDLGITELFAGPSRSPAPY